MSIPVLAMCSFALSMSASPGPVNLLILSNALNRGFKPTLPLVSGATLGFTALLSVLASGLHWVSPLSSSLFEGMTYLAVFYLVYLAAKLASAPGVTNHSHSVRADFRYGLLLQILNPKAWLACLAGISLFAQPHAPEHIWIFVAIYFVLCYACLALWAYAGAKGSRWLHHTSHSRYLNLSMSGFLLLSALTTLMPIKW